MLYEYPLAATNDNRIHNCVCFAIKTIHAHITAGTEPPPWPQILPQQHQDLLRERKALPEKLKEYHTAVKNLSPADRDEVFNELTNQNRIAELLAGTAQCKTIAALNPDTHKVIKELFDAAFDLVGDEKLGIRERHYKEIYDQSTSKMCPFCGLSQLSAPGLAREDYDHYLLRSVYPFAGANLRNLVPMCNKCNGRYKLEKDILRESSTGKRRRAFDPYHRPQSIRICVDRSRPLASATKEPSWEIDFDPPSEEAETWNDVFRLKDRLIADGLTLLYSRCLTAFGAHVGRLAEKSHANAHAPETIEKALANLESDHKRQGLIESSFLKAAIFRMLRRHVQSGYPGLIDHLRNSISVIPKSRVARAMHSQR